MIASCFFGFGIGLRRRERDEDDRDDEERQPDQGEDAGAAVHRGEPIRALRATSLQTMAEHDEAVAAAAEHLSAKPEPLGPASRRIREDASQRSTSSPSTC